VTGISSPSTTPAQLQGVQRRTRALSWLRRGLLGIGIAIVALVLLGATYQAIATTIDRRTYPPPGQLVDVGGYRLHLNSQGENHGNPTVVLIGCGGCTSANWGWVQPEVATFTRVVAYDRAGFGWSDPGPAPRDALQNAQELHMALTNAEIPGPYVLVGHSYGGPVARVFTAQFTGDVVGMVLLDPRHPDQDARFPTEAQNADAGLITMLTYLARVGVLRLLGVGMDQARDLPRQQQEEYAAFYNSNQFWESVEAQGAAIQATDAQTRNAGSLGSMPLIVISADSAWLNFGGPPDEARRIYTEMNVEQAGLSSNSAHRVVAGATHTSLVNEREDAQATIDAIREVVEAVRTGTLVDR
jgi:pimeloyl-ACP methyl ester carboxylesterase